MEENTMISPDEGTMILLDGLARQARSLTESTVGNLMQLGRVFTEAKKLVPRGEWGSWLRENSGMSERRAQKLMQAYGRFGNDERMKALDVTKVFDLLLLPQGTEEKFLENNDVEKMTSREIESAVQKAREEERAKARESMEAMRESNLNELAKARESYEKSMQIRMDEILVEKEAENQETIRRQEEQLSALREEMREHQQAAEELKKKLGAAEEAAKEATQAAIDGTQDIRKQNAAAMEEARKLRREIEEKDELLKELQEEYNQVNALYLDAQSAIAKGDAERTTADILSAEAVGDAVRVFIGQVGRVPFMHGTFAMMDDIQREEYRANVMQVKEWADKSLKALDSVNGIGGVVE